MLYVCRGDFKSVRNKKGRSGIRYKPREMVEFNEFIDLMELENVPLIRNNFIW